ncbi:phage tail family protein [Gudongella sp. SC589]|uniref:phage tail family protein n=1 Tax=Gudongella sp. SC589 TaxID=3385990 RepID=UPI003904D6C7
MERITFINSKGQSIELGNDGPFVLTKIEGTGAVNIDIQSSKSPYQDGISYHGNTLEPRPLSIEVMILAGTIEEMMNHRRTISRAFNPKLNEGTLIYKIGGLKREIKAISELAPVFPDAEDFKDVMQPGLIQLFAPNPFWLDEYETSEEIVTWIGGMRFPLRLPTTFSKKGPKKINIINNGDVVTPVKVEFKGPATNPRITNHTTGEYIQVNRTLLQDDVLVITTDFGNKRVEINENNVFNWIDLGSKFWQLEAGDNIVEYTSDDEIESAQVKISYRNRYLGI